MLIIRQSQEEVFAEIAQRRFEQRVVDHLKKIWPEECASLGEDGLRQTIAGGLARAREHGFATEYDLVRFLDLMFSLALDFDTNARIPWAAEILRRQNMEPTRRMDLLHERTEKELTAMAERQTKGR